MEQLRSALMVTVILAGVAGAAHSAELTDAELKCQTGTSKADAKFVKAATKCVDKCIQSARKVPPLNPESDCFPPYGGAALICLGDVVKGAYEKAVASIDKVCLEGSGTADCPECYSGPGDCSEWGYEYILNRIGQLESLAPTIFCTDGGSSQTRAENKCESRLAKTLAKFTGCQMKCHDKCHAELHKGTIDPGSCNPPASDPATAACGSACASKAIMACDKACFTPPAVAPDCYSLAFSCASIVNLVDVANAGNLPVIYCSSPSGAFLSE